MQTLDLPYDGKTDVYTWREGVGIITNAVRESGFVQVGKKYPRKYYNEFMTFDIETTRLENELFVPDEMAEMYHYFNYTNAWAVYIGDKFIFGREISEYFSMLSAIQKMIDGYVMVFVHNLAYEFNNNVDYFLKTAYQDAFFRTASTPLYVRLCGFEFRCTAQLTHKSLKQLGSEIKYEKLTEEYDYNVIRSPRDPLPLSDINYSLRDVKILYLFIKKEINGYATQTNKAPNPNILPLTQTGYVRKDIRKSWSDTNEGRRTLYNVALSREEYGFIRTAFYGGYTHANFRVIGKEFLRSEGDALLHVDLKSAYPWAICTKNFALKLTELYEPITEWRFKEMLMRENFGIVADITLFDVKLKQNHVPFIPHDSLSIKSVQVKTISENGKLVRAEALRITLCDTDARLIFETYDVQGGIKVNRIFTGIKRPLPYAIVSTVIKYFCSKSELKGLKTGDPETDEYNAYLLNLRKQMLNSVYGLFATSCEHFTYKINERTLDVQPSEEPEYKTSEVLPYQIALQITAYVREAIMNFCNFLCSTPGCDYWYSDTDSVFCKDTPEAREYLVKWNDERKREAERMQLLYFDFIPKSPEGVPQILGCFDIEPDCIESVSFCTIGAKRYYIGFRDGTYEITFSGMRATKRHKDKSGQYHNGANTDRLIKKYKTLHKAFMTIKENSVTLPYEEGVDKLGHYNVRARFQSTQFGYKVKRPCSYTLYGQAATYSLNPSLKWFLQSKEFEEIIENE